MFHLVSQLVSLGETRIYHHLWDFTRIWDLLGGCLTGRISGGYGVIYFTTSLPKVFPSESFAEPDNVTL